MTETGKDIVSSQPLPVPVRQEAEPRTPHNLVISTDISSGSYTPLGIPFERDDGLTLLMIRTLQQQAHVKPLLVSSIFGNVSAETSYSALKGAQEVWGGEAPKIVEGAAKAGEPSQPFVDQTLELLRRTPGTLTLVSLGPLTDIAEVIERAKEEGLEDKIQEAVLSVPSADIEAEKRDHELTHNSRYDPEALRAIRVSGIPLVYGWHGEERHYLADDLIEKLENSEDELTRFVGEGLKARDSYLRKAGRARRVTGMRIPGDLPGGRMSLQDMVVAVYLARPDLFDRKQTQYGWRVRIKEQEENHREVDTQVRELLMQ